MPELSGKRIAILATDGFEQSELEVPNKRLTKAGASVDLVSLRPGKIRGWHDGDWGEKVGVDRTVDEVAVDEYDALVLPGGVLNPDKLRMDALAVEFVRAFAQSGKTLARRLPRSVDARGGGRHRRPQAYVLAVGAHRSRARRCDVGRPGKSSSTEI